MTGAYGMHLLGFDLLDLRRAPPAAGLSRRILSDRERARLRDVDEVWALLAVKEAVLKAIGGRPVGFRWQMIEVEPSGRTTSAARALGGRLGGSPTFVACLLQGPANRAAAMRLGLTDTAAVRCRGCWAVVEEEVRAAVVVEQDPVPRLLQPTAREE